MSKHRPIFARLLIALLLSLWAVGPLHCLAGLGGDDMVICRATPATQDAPMPGLALDHACPACAGLAWSPAPPSPTLPSVTVAWIAAVAPLKPSVDRVLSVPLAPWRSRAPPLAA